MGSDKGLMERNGKTWVVLAKDKLAQFNIPVAISVREEQKAQYSQFILPNEMVLDVGDVKGPLAGLISAHTQFPEKDLLVIACDLPDLNEEVIEKLVETYLDKSEENDFIAFQQEGEYEPLVGVYTAKGLSKIKSLLTLGQLRKHSMKYILEIGNTYPIEIHPEWRTYFKNYNEKS
jgi:molybdopterin-guanine dinucleotide biosynthesis protein A